MSLMHRNQWERYGAVRRAEICFLKAVQRILQDDGMSGRLNSSI
jgi:hypothetical protein